MSFNVNLSDEQMEFIAGLTADKVNQTRSHSMRQEEYYIGEIQTLERKITKLNQIIVSHSLREQQAMERASKYIKRNKELTQKISEIESKVK